MFENRLYFSTMTVNERPCEINSNDRLALTSLPGHSSQTTSPAQESWGGGGVQGGGETEIMDFQTQNRL